MSQSWILRARRRHRLSSADQGHDRRIQGELQELDTLRSAAARRLERLSGAWRSASPDLVEELLAREEELQTAADELRAQLDWSTQASALLERERGKYVALFMDAPVVTEEERQLAFRAVAESAAAQETMLRELRSLQNLAPLPELAPLPVVDLVVRTRRALEALGPEGARVPSGWSVRMAIAMSLVALGAATC